MITVTVWEKTDYSDAVEREFEIDGDEIENARDYCRWANDNAGREIYFTYNPDEK